MAFDQIQAKQTSFLETPSCPPKPPSTRYQGSKFKLLRWLWSHLQPLGFESALDAFGGTGSVSYALKANGKSVTYNDHLKFNHLVGLALIENTGTQLSAADVDSVLNRDPSHQYDDFIERTFEGIYFTEDENRWLDVVCQNIHRLEHATKRAMAFYALFQSCIIKRPYNLFHRKHLYMRTAQVKRGFGNKATWDTPFVEHFSAFVKEVNNAVFDSGVPCVSACEEATEVSGDYDLVYIDTPYLNGNGVGVDYFQFYHFLEGMTDYRAWPNRINLKKKHRPLQGPRSPWSDPRQARDAFARLFERYSQSILVVSYRSDGIPSEDELLKMLQKVKRNVRCIHYGDYKYVLSTNAKSRELLFLAE